MNCYLIIEDGVSCCVRANTMAEATSIREGVYLEKVANDLNDEYREDDEVKFYQENILESCALVGKLAN